MSTAYLCMPNRPEDNILKKSRYKGPGRKKSPYKGLGSKKSPYKGLGRDSVILPTKFDIVFNASCHVVCVRKMLLS